MREDAPATRASEHTAQSAEPQGSLVVLALLSLLVGAASGLVGAVFRLTLEQGDRLRDAVIAWAHGRELVGLLLIIGVSAAATGLAAWLVRRHSPEAAGSGIPHVEAVLNGDLPPASFTLIPVKFFGGLLAIGAGLALGREGPSVQMGASLAHLVGVIFRRSWPDSRVLLAAGAGAGLATAFGAPIAGAVFVLEELVRRFDTRITITTLGASAGAIAVARVLLGNAPDFHVAPLPQPGFGTLPIYLALGVVAGFLGIAYNRTLLSTLAAADRLAPLAGGTSRRADRRGSRSAGVVCTRLWSAAETPSRSACSPGQRRLSWLRSCSSCASGLGPCHTRQGRRAGCLPPCLSWGLKAVCSSGASATTGSLAWLHIPQHSPSSGWRRSLPPSCGPR